VTRFTLNTPSYLSVEHDARVCLDCGLIQAKTDPVKARQCIAKLAGDELKSELDISDEDRDEDSALSCLR